MGFSQKFGEHSIEVHSFRSTYFASIFWLVLYELKCWLSPLFFRINIFKNFISFTNSIFTFLITVIIFSEKTTNFLLLPLFGFHGTTVQCILSQFSQGTGKPSGTPKNLLFEKFRYFETINFDQKSWHHYFWTRSLATGRRSNATNGAATILFGAIWQNLLENLG